MKSFIRIIDKLNTKTGAAVSWLTIVLVLVTCYDVIVRYVFKESSVAFQEFEWHLFSIIFLAGAAYTLKIDEHVRVDLFYSKFSDKRKALIDFSGSVLFLIPFCLLVIWSSKDFVINSFIMKETSPDAGGLPARYIIKSLIPVSFFLLLLQGISLALKSFIKLKSRHNPAQTDG